MFLLKIWPIVTSCNVTPLLALGKHRTQLVIESYVKGEGNLMSEDGLCGSDRGSGGGCSH